MIFSILIIIVCILLILVVLVQNSKGGGIQSQFGAATQIMGVKRGTEFIEKATWGLAMVLILLSILMAPKSSMTPTTTSEESGSLAKKRAGTAVATPQPQQAAPVQQGAPAEQPK
ncbi:MAG: preprotein translocase subunit SecG [Bacteroidota bacterium]|nr:preprotein translocase subunit SecG [Bacteroidota bacterium]MDP3144867.1 preprotein translocase subunit SecG [Bacteroidota bacterium]MDP3557125.1 preprotein translocase subunit SecG [Bacteroidota bacterium]